MAASNNSVHRRITGRLRLSGRSAILETAKDTVFYLVTPEDLAAFDGHMVVVEGQLSSPDRIRLIWIGSASD